MAERFVDPNTPPTAYAHQGGLDSGAPGNTVLAFREAENQGYLDYETDGRATAGGELVAAHDPDLEDGTLIASLSVADRKAVQRSGHPLVLIEELLEEFPNARWSLDAKRDERRPNEEDDPSVDLTLEVVHRQNAAGRVELASFSRQSIERMRALAPPGTISTLSEDELIDLAVDLADPSTHPSRYAGQIASVPPSLELPDGQEISIVTPEFVEGCHERDLRVCVWTVNDAQEATRLLDMGVDGIYTDELSMLKGVLQSRGQWQPRPV